MRNKNRLNNALKDALKNHQEDLHEFQWTNLESELDARPKRKYLIPVFILSLLVSGTLYYLGYTHGHRQVSVPLVQQTNNSDNPAKEFKPDVTIHNKKEHEKSNREVTHKRENTTHFSDHSRSNSSNKNSDITFFRHIVTTDPALARATEIKPLSDLDSDIFPYRFSGIHLLKNDINTAPPDIFFSASKTTAKMPALKLKKEKQGFDLSKLKFGIALGYSGIRTSIIALHNENSLHKDTRYILETETSNKTSLNLNFYTKYRLPIFPSFSLSTGVQYREISNISQTNYKLNEIPFRESDGHIAFYIHIPDSSKPHTYTGRSRIKSKNISIPLSLEYTFRQSNLFAISMHSGLLLNIQAGSKGITFNVNEPGFTEVNKLIKTNPTLSYNFGLLLSRPISKHIQIGLELLWQRDRLRYQFGYGDALARNDIYNTNLHFIYNY
jgi:hypothetical protein